MKSKIRIKFDEGQWFAVPLRNQGYAIGLVVRGNNKAICLGYFFGPRYSELPDEKATYEKKPEEAILIAKFSDIGIINGSWPLIKSARPFMREEWPIPNFGMEIPSSGGKGFLREYAFDNSNNWVLLNEKVVDLRDIVYLPKDSFSGGGAIEIKLSKILETF